jgi:outer membrane receptor protein involved in Fe transport
MFAATGVRAQTNAATEAAGASALPGDEIVVTAQKRAESVLDVPVAVTAIRQETLLERGATTISEISAFTPGLQVGSGRAGTVLTIRGINSGNDPAAATGVIIDGAPIGSSSAFAAGGSNAFDLDPSDIQRVEVLRGPQGTLFGASTLGGLVAYVTRRPSLTQFGGSAGGEVATTANGDESYLVRGAIDAPLIEDRLGVRVSGFYDRRGGFIDNQVTGGNNLNDTTRRGGRVAVYARPTDRIDINVWYGRQRLDVDGPEYILTDARGGALAGPYEYNQRYNPNRNQVADVVNGTVDIDFDAATLSYIGSYQNVVSFISRNATNSPITSIINLAGVLGLSPRLPAPPTVSVDFDFKLRKNSHELRLASNSDGPLQWIVGGFFTFEDASQNQIYEARTAVGAAVPSFEPVLEAGLLSTFKEYAGFANLTYEILPGLDLTGGIRIGRNIQRYQQTGGGVSLPGFNVILRQLTGIPSAGLPVLTPVAASRESQETYLANLAYSFGERSLFYARFASGYRPGGPNTVVPGGDPTFEPDEVDSYELGYKGEILDRRLRVEIAAYRIDWKNIQLVRTVAGLNTRFNGASARSEGVEFSLAAFPTTGLTISLTGAYGDARVNEAVPAVGAVAGERLPYAPTWSATGTVDYTFPITDGVSGVVGGVLRMVGDRNTSFLGSTTYTNIALDSYALADLRAGLQFGDVEISAFARNITNSQARLAGFSELSINEVNIARPRTIGLATSLRF